MRVFLSAIVLILLAYAASFALFVSALPVPPAKLPRADGIVALTGGESRLDAAVALLERGVGRRLLISGVDPATTKETLGRLSHGGARFACCADIGYAAQDTRGNAAEAAQWARDNDFKSLVIVTARYHMPRALSEFHAAMPEGSFIAEPVEQDGVALKDWWRHPRTVLLLHREYVKYLASLAVAAMARS